MSNFTQRVLTALVGAALVVGALWAGGWVFATLIGAVAVAAQFELYGMLRAAGTRPSLGMSLSCSWSRSPICRGTPLRSCPCMVLGRAFWSTPWMMRSQLIWASFNSVKILRFLSGG